MRIVKIDEYLVVNLYSGKRKWLTKLPTRKGAYDVIIRVKGVVKIPDKMPTLDFGEVSIPEIEAIAQAEMR